MSWCRRFAPVLLAALLCGCAHYHYTFDTSIADDGSVTRTIDFGYSNGWNEAAPEGRPDVEAIPEMEAELGMPAPVIMPDPARFFEFQLREHGLRGTWQSDGAIHPDFRYSVPSYTVRGKLGQKIPRRLSEPKRQREAYNEGTVTVSDLVLVKTYTYHERFHDYYAPEEFDTYAGVAIERLGGFFLEVLRDDLGRRYDLRAFENYFRDIIMPFAKKWKRVLYPSLLYEYGIWDLKKGDELSELRSPEVLQMAHELMALSALDEPYLNPDDAIMAAWTWLRVSMHALITRKSGQVPWSFDEIDAYFMAEEVEPGFWQTAGELSRRRYGSDEEITRRLLAVWDSFAQTWADTHHFELAVSAPGKLLYLVPDTGVVDDLRDRVTVTWAFTNDLFFPDGVTLSLVTAVPDSAAQERLLGEARLSDPKSMAEFVVLFTRLTSRTRAAALAGLRECLESGNMDGLEDAINDRLRDELGEREKDRLNDFILFLDELTEAAESEETEVGFEEP
ncbi:MAG: hypothetical protein JW889_02015 [Verrucomicrobia bacterium]|nr:hypothetical protein [Verrucomicrobiota bacterium]